ncbi:MAG: NAD(P)H-dependent glycerol-3-phosphate dehydrogenase, partial [Patescibacteria group bacterium]
ETNSKKTMSELLHLCVGLRNCTLISGPMLASEIIKGEPSFGVVAAGNKPTFKKIASLFKKTSLHLSYSRDLIGVALAGVLKNVYAIAFGIIRGLGWGNNAKGWLTTRALSEMSEIIKLLGGNKKTAYTLAGIGDLIATGSSPHSRNHGFGFEIATKGSSDIVSEGLVSLPPLQELIQGKKGDFPIFEGIYQIVINHENPKVALEKMLKYKYD